MKKLTYLFGVVAIAVSACSKSNEYSFEAEKKQELLTGFTKYIIPKGSQYSDNNPPATVTYQMQKFQVRFDESAVYKTKDPTNQDDINKLYGFSDNSAMHHNFSARIGWRFSKDSVRLFAYVYNDKIRSSNEICSIQIGDVVDCSIVVDSDKYVFTAGTAKVTMPRTSPETIAKGYKLYPYFGGDEAAPHAISIWIKEL